MTNHSGLWVIVTIYGPIVHAYGPYEDRSQARREARQMRQEYPGVITHVCKILNDQNIAES